MRRHQPACSQRAGEGVLMANSARHLTTPSTGAIQTDRQDDNFLTSKHTLELEFVAFINAVWVFFAKKTSERAFFLVGSLFEPTFKVVLKVRQGGAWGSFPCAPPSITSGASSRMVACAPRTLACSPPASRVGCSHAELNSNPSSRPRSSSRNRTRWRRGGQTAD